MGEDQPRCPDARVLPPMPAERRYPAAGARLRHYMAGTRRLERAVENRAYLHTLLLEKEPGFLVALELAMTLVDCELSDGTREACTASALRAAVTTAL